MAMKGMSKESCQRWAGQGWTVDEAVRWFAVQPALVDSKRHDQSD